MRTLWLVANFLDERWIGGRLDTFWRQARLVQTWLDPGIHRHHKNRLVFDGLPGHLTLRGPSRFSPAMTTMELGTEYICD